MSLRLQTAFQIENLPDEQNNNSFEVLLPTLDIINTKANDTKTSGATETKPTFWEKVGNGLATVAKNVAGYKYSPIVEEITFTPRAFKTETRRIRTNWINFAVDLENMEQVSITMFCSQNMLTQYYLNAWQDLIYDKEGEYFKPLANYKKDIEVYFYGSSLTSLTSAASSMLGSGDTSSGASAHFTLKGAFPVKQGTYTLQYSNDPKRLTITATFVYDKIVFDEELAGSMILAETISTGGMKVLDNLLSASSWTSNTTDFNKTYG